MRRGRGAGSCRGWRWDGLSGSQGRGGLDGWRSGGMRVVGCLCLIVRSGIGVLHGGVARGGGA